MRSRWNSFGRIASVLLISGALIAGSRYRPARVNGRPVRVRFQVPVTFSLRR